MEQIHALRVFRERLQRARSKEELAQFTGGLLKAFPDRYKPLRQYAEEGNEDIKKRLAFLKSEVKGNFLDVGSYDGFFVFELAKPGRLAVGVDMMPEAVAYGREQKARRFSKSTAEFYQAFAEELPFSNETFDTTIVSHTLEHVFDPTQSLSEAARVTKRGGKLIVIVPPDLGNDPTHVRVVEARWLEDKLTQYGKVSPQKTVGDGLAYSCLIT